MKKFVQAFLFFSLSIFTGTSPSLSAAERLSPNGAKTLLVSSAKPEAKARGVFQSLQAAIDAAQDGDEIMIEAGQYHASPELYLDEDCANCLVDPHSKGAETTRGFVISGKNLTLSGAGSDVSILITGAGYGLFIENAQVKVRDLAITGGVRSAGAEASDGAIVVKHSRVEIENIRVFDNHSLRSGEEKYPGICGIVGRQGAVLLVKGSLIENNSWDGIVLYNNAKGVFTDNIVRKGNGVGIAATWSAEAKVIRNRVSEYWKGIGAFGSAKVQAYNNVVVNQSGWGMAGSSEADFEIVNNYVASSGNCGITMWRANSKGKIVNNIITRNGTKVSWVCPRAGLLFHAGQVSAGIQSLPWRVEYNASFDNDAGMDMAVWGQQSKEGVLTAVPALLVAKNYDVNPGFVSVEDLRLTDRAALKDKGDPAIKDMDGSISDPGIYGGPHAFPLDFNPILWQPNP